MKQRIIITGITSFLGIGLVKQLLQEDCEIIAVIRDSSKNKDQFLKYEKIRVITLDLDQIKELDQYVQTADVFVHLGWDGIGSAGRSDSSIQKKNIRNSLNALEVAKGLGCARFVFAGSQAEYGQHHEIITEETVCKPISEYGKAKLCFGEQAQKFCFDSKMEYIHLRIFSVYGMGDHPWSLVNSCVKSFQNGACLNMGECTQKWNFLHINDMSEIFKRIVLCKDPINSGYYNIGSYDTRVLKEFVEVIYALSEKKGSYVFGERAANAEGSASLMPDISKVTKRFSWKPQVCFEEGISELLKMEKEK